jgi:hypothetical protein
MEATMAAKKKKRKSMLVPHPKGKPKTDKKSVALNTMRAVLMFNPYTLGLPLLAGSVKGLSNRKKHKAANDRTKVKASRKSRVGKPSSIGPAKRKKKK